MKKLLILPFLLFSLISFSQRDTALGYNTVGQLGRKIAVNADNLQKVTTRGNRTSNAIQVRSLAAADTTNTNILPNANSIIAGYTAANGVLQTFASGSSVLGGADSGLIKSSGVGSSANGQSVITNGLIQATGIASFANGYVTNASTNVKGLPATIQATGLSSKSYGFSGSGTIEATQNSAEASGYVLNTGIIRASGFASKAEGLATSTGNSDLLLASGSGSHAFGYVSGAGAFGGQITTIQSTNSGSMAHGLATNRGQIYSNGKGSYAAGLAQRKGVIQASTDGAFAHGFATDSTADGLTVSSIKATAFGAFAQGYAGYNPNNTTFNVGQILADNRGAFASGWAAKLSSIIRSSGQGSTARGYSDNGGIIYALGDGSLTVGLAVNAGDSLYAGYASTALGYNTRAGGSYSFAFGKNMHSPYGVDNHFTLGWGGNTFDVDGNTNTTTLPGAVTFHTQTEPATPAAGDIVEWWDGTAKRWKGSDGVIHTYTFSTP